MWKRTVVVSCYVDGLANRGWKLRGHSVRSCHLIADSLNELHEMARAIGMKREWFQAPPQASLPHYDLTAPRRAEALNRGSIPLDRRAFVAKLREIRQAFALEETRGRLAAIEIRHTTFLDLEPPFLSPAAARLAMSKVRGD
jgi:hypothetical protein